MSQITLRQVDPKRSQIVAGGVYIGFNCGHIKWVAGKTDIPEFSECIQGPCYKPEKLFSH